MVFSWPVLRDESSAQTVEVRFSASSRGTEIVKNPHTIGVLAWSFFTAQVANLALNWMYFPPAPVAVSALAALCLGWAAGLVKLAKAEA
jgi:hypothetical protein